jgi:hypothetical protein
MIGVRKSEIVICWIWYFFTVAMSAFSMISNHPSFYTSYNFWVFIVLNIVAIPAAATFKIKYAQKNKWRHYSKIPLALSDSKHYNLVNFDIMAVFIICLVDMFLYIRVNNAEVYSWMMNLIFVIAVLLFMLSYFDKKYGPKEMTRQEKLEERRRNREENGLGERAVGTNTNKKKKKYYTGGKKKK